MLTIPSTNLGVVLIPRTGSTSLIEMLADAFGPFSEAIGGEPHEPIAITKLHSGPIVDSLFKIVVVRNPEDWLRSLFYISFHLQENSHLLGRLVTPPREFTPECFNEWKQTAPEQRDWITDGGRLAVDRVFSLENPGPLEKFISTLSGRDVTLPHMNSREWHDQQLEKQANG